MQATKRTPEHADDGRFFAIPFATIAGFEAVAATARSLATLPPNIDLAHFARADENLDERRRWLLMAPDVARMSFYERRRKDTASGDLVVVPDRNDMAYFFRPSAEEPLFWHGVLCADTCRWSQGFSIPQDWGARIRLGPAEGA